jgi:hypothetical protein
VLLLLNFGKAFGKIECNFLFMTLEQLGFDSKWIKWVSLLEVKINGEPSQPFKLQTVQ